MKRSALVIASLVLACSSPKENPAADAGNDAAVTDTGTARDVGADGGATDMSPVDASVNTCPDAPECEPHERRMSDCSCRSEFDRLCYEASDCRPEEECRPIEGKDFSVCWFEPPPLQACPGGDGCPDNQGQLLAGAARKSVTPLGFETPTANNLDGVVVKRDPYRLWNVTDWNDCGLDGLCPTDAGYTGPDEGEDDGVPQGMWIAGFSTGRAAQYCAPELIGCDGVECCVSKFAHDNVEVNLVVFRQGGTTVAFAAIDSVGFFHTDIENIRKTVQERADVDLLVMAATHNHEAPDTSGQWGPGKPAPTSTGRVPAFFQRITDQTVAGIEEAIAALEPVDVAATVVDAGVDGLAIGDSRAPYIFDDNIPVVQVTSQNSGETVATMYSIGNHVEVRWSQNVHITADYFGYAREFVREGIDAVADVNTGEMKPALPGKGGVAVMFAGAVGGLINPGKGGGKDYAGNEFEGVDSHTWEATRGIGQQVAARVLSAELAQIPDPRLTFATKKFLVPAENRQLQLAALALNLMVRDTYNSTRVGARLEPDGVPYVLSQVAVVKLGGIEFFTAPGEMFPEMLVGGFPGKARVQNPVVGDVRQTHTPATCDEDGLPTANDDGTYACIITKDAENPPDWSTAPDGPYGYELIEADYPFFIGLGMDFLGYMVPPYDYEEVGFFTQAPGDHYEETNGIGSTIVADWRQGIEECIDALP